MAKLKSLTNNILKELLKTYELETTGTKAQMVTRLTEYIGSDEVERSVLDELTPNNNVQSQINELKEMMESLMRTVSGNQQVANNQRTNEMRVQSEERQNENLIDVDTDVVNVSEVAVTTTATATSANAIEETTRFRMTEVMAILPQFDPMHGTINAKQFIDKIESLKTIYGWSNEVVLYAVQGKLVGHARLWADAHEIFRTWEEFTTAILTDFPCEVTMADEHLAMANTHQNENECMSDYYYKMLAKGRRAKMDDQSIIRHIINGLNDDNIKRTCNASVFLRCTDLLQALNVMSTMVRPDQPEHMHSRAKFTNNNSKTYTKYNDQSENKTFVCYNCGGNGHISRNCPKPQKHPRCTRCDKVHRKGQTSCEEHSVKRIVLQEGPKNVFEKQVKIAGDECAAYIDSGSECHLIRQSCVKKLRLQPISCAMNLNGLWGGTCRATEKVDAQIEIDDVQVNAVLYVVNDDVLTADVLLGRKIFEIPGVNTQINSTGLQFIKQSTIMQNSVVQTTKDTIQPKTENKLSNLITEFDSIFSKGLTNIGKTELVEMTIELAVNEVVQQKPYRVPEPKKNVVREMIGEMLENDIIEESTSEYASPMILVKKKNGTNRLCVDYRRLNRLTRRENFPTPNIEELMQEAKQYKYFTSLDLNSGYYQIPIAPNCRKFTAFITTDGLYQFKRMPFGLTNAPAVFQRLMSKVRQKLPRHDFISYMDDILIGSNSEDDSQTTQSIYCPQREQLNFKF